MGKMLCDAMEAEVVRTMGTVGTLAALIFLGSILMLACVDIKVVLLGESFGACVALKRAWSIGEMDLLVEADIVLLGGAIIALRAFVGFFSSMDAYVNADFGLVSE